MSTNPNNIYCVIMAGGIGSRFWPLSRAERPKQFIDILGTGKSLLVQTFERMAQICPEQNIFVVTSEQHGGIVREQLPQLEPNRVLLEPMRRNTAPCIAYATQRIRAIDPQAVMVVAPSDHLILNEAIFAESMRTTVRFAAQNNALLTLGIKPSRPETGYGYIQMGAPVADGKALFRVKTFTEKPNIDMARVFLDSGEFLWNSGIFVWSVEAISQALDKHLPEVSGLFEQAASAMGTPCEAEAIARIYPECRNISIDYGIMEKADNVLVMSTDFGWSDLGTWGALHGLLAHDAHGNAVSTQQAMLYDSSNLMLNQTNPNKLVVVQGLDGYIVVDTDDVLLICRQQDEQRIKDFVNDVTVSSPSFS